MAKIRTDFVTNSSSSSFIISAAKLGENVTKDTVFNYVNRKLSEISNHPCIHMG